MNKKISFPIALIIIIVLAVLVGAWSVWSGIFQWQNWIVQQDNKNSFDCNSYLPGKIFFSTFTSGEWGTFNADHTVVINWGLDYAGPNDNRPTGEIDNWNIDKNILTIARKDGTIRSTYDFERMKKINDGEDIVFADQYNNDDGLVSGIFFGDAKAIEKITKIKNPLSQTTDQTAGWKIYKNDEYGVEFKYPENYFTNIKKEETQADYLIIGKVSELFKSDDFDYKNNKYFPFINIYFARGILPDELVNALKNPSQNNLKVDSSNITLSNLSGIDLRRYNTLYHNMDTTCESIGIVIPVGNADIGEVGHGIAGSIDLQLSRCGEDKNLELPDILTDKDKKILDQILSSFKFTK